MKKKIPTEFLEQLRDIQGEVHKLSTKVDEILDVYNVPVTFEEVKEYIKNNRNTSVSTSWLQRRYRIGYVAAVELMDLLEKNKVVAPRKGSEPRKILLKG